MSGAPALFVPGAHYTNCTTAGCPGCFVLPPTAPRKRSKPDVSPDRARTIRNNELIEQGIHPATRHRIIAGPSLTCAGCVHSVKVNGGRRSYWKCERNRLGISASAASDIRVSWPACAAYEHEVAS